MSTNLDKLIRQTEEKWLNPLYNQCIQQFSKVHMPSHDETHHARVWSFAKMLVQRISKHGYPVSETDLERLMIAAFFHDQGMSESLSKEHGKISRHICKTFFATTGLTPPSGFDNVLQAIEKHDQKEYSTTYPVTDKFDIQKLLNIADDLDALGVVGAYRYLEIYLLRNVNMNLLPDTVLTNLGGRFQHFSDTFESDSSLIKAQSHRYIYAKNYFKDLNMQLKLVEYTSGSGLGPIGVVNFIRNEIIDKKRKLLDACNEAISNQSDFYVQHFFERLKKEMDSNR